MQLQKKHRRIMGTLLEGDDVVGMGAADIANSLRYYNSFRIYGVLNDLLKARYVQTRIEGVHGRTSDDRLTPSPKRLARSTA